MITRTTCLLSLVFAMGACTRASDPAPASNDVVAGDPVCRPPTHQCPKCGNQGGYYCGTVCMNCPVTAAETDTPAALQLHDEEALVVGQQCGYTVCTGSTHCCNASCSLCTPKGVQCTQQTCD